MDMKHKIQMAPIGFVESPATDCVDENWGSVTARINLLSEYRGSLTGLEDFSHALIVTYLHRAQYIPSKHLQRRPRGMDSMPEVGLFSQRVKDRPNPIGVTAVEILEIGDDYLQVLGLDAVDETPVIDIKPYFPHFDRVKTPRVPEWVDRLMENYF